MQRLKESSYIKVIAIKLCCITIEDLRDKNKGFILTMLKCHILALCATKETQAVFNDVMQRLKESSYIKVIAIKLCCITIEDLRDKNKGFILTMLKCHILALCATKETQAVFNDVMQRLKESSNIKVIAIKLCCITIEDLRDKNKGFILTKLKCHILALCATKETQAVFNDGMQRLKESSYIKVIAIHLLHFYRGSKGQE